MRDLRSNDYGWIRCGRKNEVDVDAVTLWSFDHFSRQTAGGPSGSPSSEGAAVWKSLVLSEFILDVIENPRKMIEGLPFALIAFAGSAAVLTASNLFYRRKRELLKQRRAGNFGREILSGKSGVFLSVGELDRDPRNLELRGVRGLFSAVDFETAEYLLFEPSRCGGFTWENGLLSLYPKSSESTMVQLYVDPSHCVGGEASFLSGIGKNLERLDPRAARKPVFSRIFKYGGAFLLLLLAAGLIRSIFFNSRR